MAVSTNRKKLFHSLQWPKLSNNAIFYITSGRGEIVLLHVFSASSAAGVMYRHQSGQHSFMGHTDQISYFVLGFYQLCLI